MVWESMKRSLMRKKWIILGLFLIFLFIYTLIIIQIHLVYLNRGTKERNTKFIEYKAPANYITHTRKWIRSSPHPQIKKHVEKRLTTTRPNSQFLSTQIELEKKLVTNDANKCTIKKHPLFPHCEGKIQYLKLFWQQDCFRKVHGVDGTDCSILEYFTKIEPFCAPKEKPKNQETIVYGTPNYNLDGLLKLLSAKKFDWMRQRAKDMWSDWVDAVKYFTSHSYQRYKKKKVSLLMGSFGFQPHLFELAGKGGPLGELVQWTDILCGLYVLGYDVTITDNVTEAGMQMPTVGKCAPPITEETKYPEVIFTDFNGIVIADGELGGAVTAKYKCRYRVLDSFGTWPEYNDPSYPFKIPGGRSPWAGRNIIPQQLFTLYPHTHDNTFLGFVVGGNKLNQEASNINHNKKDKALLYAKFLDYCDSKENRNYLRIVSEYFQIEATTIVNVKGFDYIKSHGPVSGSKVKELLKESKVFLGCGFPYEGPGPLEAMAAGTPFIQPKFSKPKNKMNDEFFKDKPTLRRLTSQSPYMEEFVGEPYAYTIDVTNETLLRETLQKIKTMKPLRPKIPREFTNLGMLERLHVFIEHMDFCDIYKEPWPPKSHLQVRVAEIGQSCKDICMQNGLVCERSFFHDLNNKKSIENYGKMTCSSLKEVFYLHAPSYDSASNICYIQKNTQLYSCSHVANGNRQICPCRDYMQEQSALCKDCL